MKNKMKKEMKRPSRCLSWRSPLPRAARPARPAPRVPSGHRRPSRRRWPRNSLWRPQDIPRRVSVKENTD